MNKIDEILFKVTVYENRELTEERVRQAMREIAYEAFMFATPDYLKEREKYVHERFEWWINKDLKSQKINPGNDRKPRCDEETLKNQRFDPQIQNRFDIDQP